MRSVLGSFHVCSGDSFSAERREEVRRLVEVRRYDRERGVAEERGDRGRDQSSLDSRL